MSTISENTKVRIGLAAGALSTVVAVVWWAAVVQVKLSTAIATLDSLKTLTATAAVKTSEMEKLYEVNSVKLDSRIERLEDRVQRIENNLIRQQRGTTTTIP